MTKKAENVKKIISSKRIVSTERLMSPKRITALLITGILLMTAAGCGNAGTQGDGNSQPENTQSQTVESTQAQQDNALESETTAAQDTGAAASDNSQVDGQEENSEASGTAANGDSNILVAYFSWADNAILEEDVDAVTSPSVIAPGNVQELAGWVQEQTEGDLFSIRVAEPYSSDWDECLSRANDERGEDARPELVENVENLDQYDTVFLGYPNWWYGVPMALLSFLEENDLSGKQVYLFCSHGTGGVADSVDIIEEAIPNAEISDNVFDCYEEDASSSQDEIQSWLGELGY
ncbi:flavodoxin [Eubacteriaceae bacterium CHKCI004]|nr:flavodoxin [Eubacteriaceae bacterium CHKCI004]